MGGNGPAQFLARSPDLKLAAVIQAIPQISLIATTM
jgi:hypothetical protein